MFHFKVGVMIQVNAMSLQALKIFLRLSLAWKMIGVSHLPRQQQRKTRTGQE